MTYEGTLTVTITLKGDMRPGVEEAADQVAAEAIKRLANRPGVRSILTQYREAK